CDIRGEDEINFIVLENGFPLFSRDIFLSAGDEGGIGFEGKAQEDNFERLKTELRFSLDYYHRKFPAKSVEKIFVLSDLKNLADIKAYLVDTGFSVEFININKMSGISADYSLSSIKAYTASLYKSFKVNIRINLLESKEKQKPKTEKATKVSPLYLIKGLRINKKVIAVSILGWGIVLLFAPYRVDPIRRQINNIINSRTLPFSVNAAETVEGLTNIKSTYNDKIAALDKLFKFKDELYATSLLNVITKSLPEGVWLNSLNFQREDSGRLELKLAGVAYLKDSGKELEAVNKFISNLQESQELKPSFKKISIVSINRSQVEDVGATDFSINCK
ncbi:MAG: PilN domain-containing protein, partial [Candidatus Omnitrophica bacterium]|nr:PilN domain-containing protein [Candidatus Omnitrophota bacterium]